LNLTQKIGTFTYLGQAYYLIISVEPILKLFPAHFTHTCTHTSHAHVHLNLKCVGGGSVCGGGKTALLISLWCLVCIHYLVVGRKRGASPTACSTPGEAPITKLRHVNPQLHEQYAEEKDGCLPQSLSKYSQHLAMLFAIETNLIFHIWKPAGPLIHSRAPLEYS